MLRHVVFLACSVVLLACVMETPSTAQSLDKRTLFTFSGPVEPRRRHVSLAHGAQRQLEVKPLCGLEVVDDLEEISCLRVATWT